MINHSAPYRTTNRDRAGGQTRRFVPVTLAFALGAALTLGSSWPGARPAAAADPTAGASDAGSGAVDPGTTSISYQEALEHQNDPDTFVPGGAVTVPYRPRAGDTTEVDGGLPVALPAGTASGRSMAASPQGSVSAINDVAAPTSAASSGSAAAPSPTPAQGPATPAANVLRREIYGFLPYWESVAGPTLNYDILSTVAYFGVGVDGNGNLQKHSNGNTSTGWAGWTSSWMTNVINNAHAHGTRVALTIEEFAWSTSETNEQVQLLSSAANRLNAAQQIAAAVSQRGADGVNLDFEPIASTQEGDYTALRTDPPSRARQDPSRLRADLLRDRRNRLLRRCGPHRGGRGRCRLHHGLRLPNRQLELSPARPTRSRAPNRFTTSPASSTRGRSGRRSRR